jgi:hypothetical protein
MFMLNKTKSEKLEKDVIKEDAETVRNSTAIILFSGGYDSTAVLNTLIEDKNYKRIVVIYENGSQMPDGYHDIGREKAIEIFNILNKKAKQKNIKLDWKDINIASDITANNGCDGLLMIHLATILTNSNDANTIYLAWNKQHIDILSKLQALPCSTQVLEMFKTDLLKYKHIYFLDDIFTDYTTELERKSGVITYLLNKNLFGLCYSYDNFCLNNYKYEREEYIQNKTWFFKDDDKSRETATALIQTGLFNQKEIVDIFNLSTTQQIQNYYNAKSK